MSSKILGAVWDACAAHDIKGAKLMIMARLADYSNDDGVSYPGVETICRQLGLGESTVRTAISELESTGWLRREARRKGNRNTSNLYFLNAERLETLARHERDKVKESRLQKKSTIYFQPSDSEPSDSDPSDTEPSQGSHPPDSGKNRHFDPSESGGELQGLKHDPQVNSKHESQGIGAQAGASTPAKPVNQEYPPEFENAWQTYPKRAGGNSKAAAFKAWKARLHEGATAEAMIAGVERYAAFAASTGKVGTEYVKQGATFFGPDRHFQEAWALPVGKSQGHPNNKHGGFESRNYGETEMPAWARGNS